MSRRRHDGPARTGPWAMALTLMVLVTTITGCGADPDSESGGGGGGTVLVLAAASLADAFADIEAAFERANPGIDVQLSLAGSSALREQVLEGAPADVYASADQANMEQLAEAGALDGEPAVFARNRLEIAVPAGNPASVTGLADLGDDDLLIGLCAEGVPCGDLGRQVLAGVGVVPAPDTNEPDVRALLTKIGAGELDAGLVYATDVVAADGRVDGIPIPAGDNIDTSYPIAALAEAPDADGADELVAFVLSEEGQRILADRGFLGPGG